jgi:D-glycero-alpha-D-manno-heptose-7-phosphate kinase
MQHPLMVTTRTPLRLSFNGGGTDLPVFYEREEGAVLSSAIDKYLYVTVKRHNPLFLENYRLNYSDTEHVDKLDDIKNSIARECLRFMEVKPPIYISTIADLPGSTGLGSSASFTVGLLNALHTLAQARVSAVQLAEEACYIEMEALKKPIGKQDQYAAAFGGFNQFFFQASGKVVISPKHLPGKQIERFFDSLLLFWTGISRSADVILKTQQENTNEKFASLREMRDLSFQLATAMEKTIDLHEFGEILSAGWNLKRDLTDSISSSQIDAWYHKALQAGAYGGKLCGAGGGGFLLFVVPEAKQPAVRQALSELACLSVRYESKGSQVVYLDDRQL